MPILNGPDSCPMKKKKLWIQAIKQIIMSIVKSLLMWEQNSIQLTTHWNHNITQSFVNTPWMGGSVPDSAFNRRFEVCQISWIAGCQAAGHMGRIPAGWLLFNCKSIMHISFTCQKWTEYLLCARHLLGSAD